ncbi:hypothetical protein WR25_24641 [Diploscapter pachys]|uniref:Uncharacterized protein n=1 Tax=Diploscapter pachys TaxID=2018661 RepID=A0A2A2M2L2_9BILA|nr:hypothetical protein WR25_24641 [Diploscapter pachys]
MIVDVHRQEQLARATIARGGDHPVHHPPGKPAALLVGGKVQLAQFDHRAGRRHRQPMRPQLGKADRTALLLGEQEGEGGVCQLAPPRGNRHAVEKGGKISRVVQMPEGRGEALGEQRGDRLRIGHRGGA